MTKCYSPPATPCDRVTRHEAVSAETKAALSERRAAPDPSGVAARDQGSPDSTGGDVSP